MSTALRLSLAALAICATSLAAAQYAGPSTTRPATIANYASVADILKNPVDDAPVLLQGTLLRQVGKEKYIFTDGTGEIRVEIDTKHFAAAKVDDKVKVQIQGDVEKDFLQSPEIDVEKMTLVQ